MNTKTDGISSGLVPVAWLAPSNYEWPSHFISLTEIRNGEALVRLSDAEAIISDLQNLVVAENQRKQQLEAYVEKQSAALWLASAPEGTEDVIDAVTIALRKAFQLGQTYWQQADSDYISQNKKSDETYSKFLKLSEEISALLTAALTSPVSEDRKDAERLNYLQEHGATVHLVSTTNSNLLSFVIGGLHRSKRLNLREAIDAAMQENKP